MVTQKTFLDFVEQTTDRLEVIIEKPDVLKISNEPEISTNDNQISTSSEEPHISLQFKPKHDMFLAHKVTGEITKIWDTVNHRAEFEGFLDVILAALERREDDYMSLIKGMDKQVLEAYAKIYGALSNYFLDGNYGDPLGSFYMEHFSYGRNGEFYTPWNVAHFMAEIMNPTPEQTVCDPCCGSGIMLLAARCVIHEKYGWLTSSRYGRNLYGMDISSKATKMAKINIYLTDYVYMICLMNEVVFEIQNKRSDLNERNNDGKT